MRQSNSFLQFAKGSLIAFRAIAKGNQITFRANCRRNLRIACNADTVGNIPLGELNLKFKKWRQLLKFYPRRFLYPLEPVQPYHFQADQIWCDGTFKAIYFIIYPPADPHKVVVVKNVEWAKKRFFVALVHAAPVALQALSKDDITPCSALLLTTYTLTSVGGREQKRTVE